MPNNIQREHIFQAMLKIHFDGIPARADARDWALQYEEEIYPCKLIIAWANIFANGKELDRDAANFNTYMAQDYLRLKGFTIIAI